MAFDDSKGLKIAIEEAVHGTCLLWWYFSKTRVLTTHAKVVMKVVFQSVSFFSCFSRDIHVH